jgi:hypothetical protein
MVYLLKNKNKNMIIGTLEHPDNCPECGMRLIKKPCSRTIREGSSDQYSVFTIKCYNPDCGYETGKFKIKYEPEKRKEPIDVTPQGKSFWSKLFKK